MKKVLRGSSLGVLFKGKGEVLAREPGASMIGKGLSIHKAFRDAILSDGAVGHVLRHCTIYIQDGTNANTIKVQLDVKWNCTAIGVVDNLAAGGSVGDFSLDAGGDTLTIANNGLDGDAEVCLAAVLYQNETLTPMVCGGSRSGSGLKLYFFTPAGGAVNLTTAVDGGAGRIRTYVTYLTVD